LACSQVIVEGVLVGMVVAIVVGESASAPVFPT
jgi:hypothetical protein